jgi:hypothetical protein
MSTESNELLAARAQLLALRASLPEGIRVPKDTIRILPDSRVLTEVEAAADLAARRKPLECIPSLVDGALAFRAEPPEPGWVQVLEAANRAEASEPKNQDRLGPDAVVLLKGRDEALPLPGPAYRVWRRDYQLPGNSGLGGGPPSDEERSEGVTFVWTVGRTEPLIQAYSLSPDSSVICEKCGANSAVAVLRDKDVEPPVKSLLCSNCLEAENGRKLASVINQAAESPPFPTDMSDDQAREFFRNFRLSSPEDS